MTELRHRFHGHGDSFTVEAIQDTAPILDRNKAMQNAGKQTGDLRLVASIPAIFIEKFLNEKGANLLSLGKSDFEQVIRRMRRDPDYRHLFTG